MSELGISAGASAPNAEERSVLSGFRSIAENHKRRIHDVVRLLRQFNDTIIGPVPSEVGSAADRPVPSSHIEALNCALNDEGCALTALESEIERLGNGFRG